ncbi:MAG: chemotaxis protein CheB [Steroidobacteraceae bacterium]
MSAPAFPVVGIGASAGGLEAFRSFFEHLPPDSGMAYVVILHLPRDHKSMLVEILGRWTSMPVVEATQGTQVVANHVYVPPPHAIVKLHKGIFTIEAGGPDDRVFRPIDEFFDSLGTDLRALSVGIVLSGTGSDGALGLKALKERGGLTIAQGTDGSGPEYGGMPAGAIATGVVDMILPVEDMPQHLLRFRTSDPKLVPPSGDHATTDAARLEICAVLREQLGHDFSDYRSQTFLRRVARRMQVLDVNTLDEYIQALKADANEVALLFRDLLIRVTSFFRDQEAFDVLAAKVIPRLFEGQKADGMVRIWIPGCATGEEAYSVAILLREHMSTLQSVPKVQLFATDIDESAITIARLGRYPSTLVDGLSAERLRRFFTSSQGSHCVAKEIRELCTFSVHNVIRDPPFSMMSLVSCRNLLIYMTPALQARVMPVFHYALLPRGILLLGGSESAAQHSDLFDTIDKAARIFQKRDGRTPELNMRWQRPTPPGPLPAIATDTGNGQNESKNLPQGRASQERPVKIALLAETRFRDLTGELAPDEQSVKRLQVALLQVCEELQSLSEEHQTALEELRSANEELHSVNEEMQSTNEELETSKEELQSLNEELHTVNIRLTEKVDELDQANSDLRNLFDSTEIATVFLDRHLIIRSFTSAITALFNLIPSDQGRPLTDIVSRLRYTTLREDVAHVLSSLEPLERRIESESRLAHYIMRIVPYREPDSTVSGALVTFIDVTSIVKAEEALVDADLRKDVFLATLSHELRNPLAPIRTAAQLLLSPKLEPEELKHAQSVIARQVAHMSSLLDDLLDVSRITRSSLLLKKGYADLRVLMDEAVEAVEPAITAKSQVLRVEPPETPLVLEVDAVRIIQVITNLLVNASKYTPAGGFLHLGYRLEELFLVITVRDNGRGLAPDSLYRVFNMFTRIESPDERTDGGLGIGLALAKGLMELHGGHLQAHSPGLGKGSEFLVCLPRELVVSAPEAPVVDQQQPTATQSRRILIADDNRDSAAMLGMLLRIAGHEVHVAHSGTEAWDEARRLRPDVCVLDIGMPGLTGYDVAERIRHEAWSKEVKLIAVTGWGQDADKRRAAAVGFDQHLTKPVDPDALEKLIAR